MRNARLNEAQAGIKISGRHINNLRYADDTTLMAESEEELKSLLMKMKEENERAGLKLNIPKTKIVASSPITSWWIDGETVRDYFLGLQNHCSWWLQHEIKRCLFLGRKTLTNLDGILKSRVITFLTKVRIVKAMVFPVVMYGCENQTIKKTEYRRIDAFKLWWWRRLLRVPWTARRSNQSIFKEISPIFQLENQSNQSNIHWKGWCWSWNSNTLALDVKNRLIGKDPDAGKDWRWEEKGTTEDEMVGWHHCLNGRKFERAPGDGEGQGGLVCCSSWYDKESDTTERLNNNRDMAKTAGDFALQKWSGVSVHGHYQQGFAISWCVLGASLGA